MKSKFPQHPRYMLKEASVWSTLGNQARRVGQYGKDIFMHNGQFNPIQGIPRALKRGYESTAAATSPTKTKNMISDALQNARTGKQIDDVATGARSGGGIRQYLREKGWLSVGRKTSGRYDAAQQEQINKILKDRGLLQDYQAGVFKKTPSTRINEKASQQQLQDALDEIRKINPTGRATFGDKAKDFAYNVLPGEKSILAAGVGVGAGGELMSTHTEQGRKKSVAERVGRAGVGAAAETLAAPLGIARRFGALGAAGELASTTLPYAAMAKADSAIGNSAIKKASIPSHPRLALRRSLK